MRQIEHFFCTHTRPYAPIKAYTIYIAYEYTLYRKYKQPLVRTIFMLYFH